MPGFPLSGPEAIQTYYYFQD